MGVNQSYEGTRVAQSIINLALMTGNIGKPGTGANSITGQCNAMGSRLFSNTTSLLGGHYFTKSEDRAKVARILGIPERMIPQQDSLAFDQILAKAEEGSIKGLWFIATNTRHSWPNRERFEALREKLDFVVVQDMYQNTRTAELADLILPAAGWGEKEGTFINSERRMGRIKKVRRAPGQALADFYIFKLIAHRWGCAELFEKWSSPEATFHLLRQISAGQPCDFSGITSVQELEKSGGVQWPCPDSPTEVKRERRLFEDGQFYFPDGRARFVFESHRQPPESPDGDYPFWLLTGRGSSSQWHTLTRTRNSDVLRKLAPNELYIEINNADAAEFGIRAQDKVRVYSRRGELIGRAAVVTTVVRGQIFIPMHHAAINRLTLDAVDPYSREPNFKACAVSIEKLDT
jgi:assimilatory nitrate reductase catalytic subunit